MFKKIKKETDVITNADLFDEIVFDVKNPVHGRIILITRFQAGIELGYTIMNLTRVLS